jgi:hypothetical protein
MCGVSLDYLALLTDFDELDLFDDAFLEQVAAAAVRITLGDGEKKTQNLRLK